MRKLLLSFFITGAFGAYIVSQKINPDKFVVPVSVNTSQNNANSNIADSLPSNAKAPTTSTPTPAKPTPTAVNTNTNTRPGNGMMNGNGMGSGSGAGMMNQGKFKDGSYVGPAADAYYGYIQVKAIVSGGKLTDVQFLQYPNDRSTSQSINQQATPYLRSEAIAAQSANVNIISGATDTSMAFRESLASALAQAAN
ncbi:MAG: FMN-binding protein [Patescibacteria group bacterium]|nr:FMN-binding protein [Patescibacteria group bacterium]